MNVEIGTEAAQFLSLEYLFFNFFPQFFLLLLYIICKSYRTFLWLILSLLQFFWNNFLSLKNYENKHLRTVYIFKEYKTICNTRAIFPRKIFLIVVIYNTFDILLYVF